MPLTAPTLSLNGPTSSGSAAFARVRTRSLSVAAALAVLGLSPVWAETKTVEVVLKADGDRANAWVCVGLSEGQSLTGVQSASAVWADGSKVAAQVTGPSLHAEKGVLQEVHFQAPTVKSGDATTVRLTLSTDAPAAGSAKQFQWKEPDGDHTDLTFDGKNVLRYMHPTLDDSSPAAREKTYKVYHHVFDPEGDRVLTKGPGGQFTHHRGLYFGWNKVTYGEEKKQCDVWHCTKDAHQSHHSTVSSEAGPLLARHRLKIHWHGVGKEVFAVETREMTVFQGTDGRLIEFASRLDAEKPPIKLDGDPQHAGFHFRADNEVSAQTKGKTYYLRPDGKDAPGKTRNWPGNKGHVNLPWNAMSFVLGDQRYTTVYLDHPDNPKEARFSERDYGRFGSYFMADVDAQHPLNVNYRVWVQRGETTADHIEALSRDFTSPVEATVK